MLGALLAEKPAEKNDSGEIACKNEKGKKSGSGHGQIYSSLANNCIKNREAR